MMHMSFWWGSDVGDFLIKGLTVNSTLSLVVLCFCLFILSIGVEAMKVHKARSRAKAAREKSRSVSCNPSENATLISNDTRRPFLKELSSSAGEISFFASHNVISYAIMLAVMGYNGYVFIAVVLGAFIGYFLFGHLSMKTNMENLQAIRTKIVCSVRCADSENPCSSGAMPIIGESSGGGGSTTNAMRTVTTSESIDSTTSSDDSQTHVIIKTKPSCH